MAVIASNSSKSKLLHERMDCHNDNQDKDQRNIPRTLVIFSKLRKTDNNTQDIINQSSQPNGKPNCWLRFEPPAIITKPITKEKQLKQNQESYYN